ncbi:MAG TPA: hypothetical protein DCX75_11925 [Brevundimonas sp.]|nr:hypothetical protein [Brevundimonas sp.]
MARPVLAAYERHQAMVNRRNSYYSRREYGADLARIRSRVAANLGVEPDEIAFTRGATEALQALIGGYNRLKPGDQVLIADLDYDSMQSAMAWLKDRRGAELVRIELPEPATRQGLIDAYASALDANPKVRLMLLTQVSHRNGLHLPVAEITALARTRGVDVILDMVGADYAALNQSVLKPGGRWCVIATLSGARVEIDLMRLMLKRIVLTGSTLRSRSADEKARLIAAVRQTAWPWVESGQVRPPIEATFPLADAGLAHLRLEAGEHIGKIVLVVD